MHPHLPFGHLIGFGLQLDQRGGLSVHMHGQSLDFDVWLYFELWIHVQQDLEGSLHLHQRPVEQEGGHQVKLRSPDSDQSIAYMIGYERLPALLGGGSVGLD